MRDYEPSTTLDHFLKAFPDAEDVFAGDVVQHRRVLQPLLSIDANAVDPSWKGRLHIVTPLEPYDGLIGDETEEFHSGYNLVNWIAFKVESSKYTFLGDFRYFRINATPQTDLEQRNLEHIQSDYDTKEKSFAETLASYRATGLLQWPKEGGGAEWLEQLGGAASPGNWCAFGLPVETEKVDNGVEVAFPLTHDGRRFRFVACVTGFRYRDNCADSILLFFDPVESIAVLTFDWT